MHPKPSPPVFMTAEARPGKDPLEDPAVTTRVRIDEARQHLGAALVAIYAAIDVMPDGGNPVAFIEMDKAANFAMDASELLQHLAELLDTQK